MQVVYSELGWYGGFEFCKRRMQDEHGKIKLHQLMAAGSMGGMSYWICCYPLDVIKARIQSNPTGSTSIIENAKQVYSLYSWRGFYRGFSMSLLRSIPSSGLFVFDLASTFTLYELVINALK
jgi:solute carrier family 25 carnitine/acylcarnitine transporter 20/29